MRVLAIVFILLINSVLVYSQKSDDYLDSLINVADEEYSDTAGYAFSELGQLLAYQRPMTSLKYLKKAIECARDNSDYKALCLNYSFMGIAYGQMGNFVKAFENFKIQLNIAKQHNVLDEYVWANNNITSSFLILRNPELAYDYSMEALRRAPELHDTRVLHYVYDNVAWLYLQRKDYDSSLYWYKRALDIRLESDTERIDIGAIYRDLGNVYFRKGDYKAAREYYDICQEYIDTVSSDINADIFSHVASIYLNNGKQDSAYSYIHKAISIAKKFHSGYILGYSYGVLGKIYMSEGKYQEAEDALRKQIHYNDSIASPAAFHIIFEDQLSQEIDRQNDDLMEINKHSRSNFEVTIMIVIFLTIAIFFSIKARKKKNVINDLNKEMSGHDKQLGESLIYAKKIQKAVLPDFNTINPECTDKFLVFEPKQKVSGDLFWSYNNDKYEMFAVGECGNTGITGACMSMISTSLLFEVAQDNSDPAKIVEENRQMFKKVIRRFNENSANAVNTDVSLVVRDKASGTYNACCIKSPIVVFHNGDIKVYNPEPDESDNLFNCKPVTTELDIHKGDTVYIMSVGYFQQHGGPDGETFSKQRLYKLLKDIHTKPMVEQKRILEKTLREWTGNREQDCDVTLAGFKL